MGIWKFYEGIREFSIHGRAGSSRGVGELESVNQDGNSGILVFLAGNKD